MSHLIDVGQPNCTLYIQNLNEKVSLKHLIPQLHETFGTHGSILSVIAKRSLPLRGQAFIIYHTVDNAQSALQALQGQRLYGKSMVIRFAKYKSDVIAQQDGTLEIERRRREMDKLERSKRPRLTRRQVLAQMPMAPQFGEVQLANKVLYLQNLPELPEGRLVEIFNKFGGFVEVRLVPNRHDVAFVEYENEAQAGNARQTLDNYEVIPNHHIRVTFARR